MSEQTHDGLDVPAGGFPAERDGRHPEVQGGSEAGNPPAGAAGSGPPPEAEPAPAPEPGSGSGSSLRGLLAGRRAGGPARLGKRLVSAGGGGRGDAFADARAEAVGAGRVAAVGASGEGLRADRRGVAADAVLLEAPVRGAGPGGPGGRGGPARADGLASSGGDEACDPDAQEREPRVGFAADPRRAVPGSGPAGELGAVVRVLNEAGYVLEESPTRPHRAQRAQLRAGEPNQLWQTDLFTFVLKRQNRRVYLVAFMDDHSRFVVGYGLHATQSAALVLRGAAPGGRRLRRARGGADRQRGAVRDLAGQERVREGAASSAGSGTIVAAPHRPQTLGKVERFWGTLWRECVETSGLPGSRRCAQADRALHRLLQLPADAQQHRAG